MSMIEIRIPDIGDFKDVPVIEVHVSPGARVAVEDPLLTLESDKATLEVPCPQAGTIGEVKVKTGDRVSEGEPECCAIGPQQRLEFTDGRVAERHHQVVFTGPGCADEEHVPTCFQPCLDVFAVFADG